MPPKRTNIRWLLIGWTFLISAIAYLDRVNISIAGKSIAKEYGLTDIQLGYVFSAFVLGYALFQPPWGGLAPRFGARWALALALFWWGVFTTLVVIVPPTLASSLLILIAIRFALGIG